MMASIVTPNKNFNNKRSRVFSVDSIRTPDANNNKLINSNKFAAEMFLKPLMVNSGKINNKLVTNTNNSSDNSDVNYTINMFNSYINENDYDKSIIEHAVFKFYMTEKTLDNYNFDSKIKNNILIASILSTINDYDDLNANIDINDFISGSSDDRDMINMMINYTYNNVYTDIDEYILIPKYITIIDKIGRGGIYKFINFLKNMNKRCNIFDEMMKYCNIVINYSFDLNQMNNIYTLRINEVKNVYEFIKNRPNISYNDIYNFLD
jgi:hypothetical protein